MKWTQLRLNMLPITAVEVQFACESLIKLHNKLLSFAIPNNYLNSSPKPIFSSSQGFVYDKIKKFNQTNLNLKSNANTNLSEEQALLQYKSLRKDIQNQILLLKHFYSKHSHDSSASLFHMLRLRLERTLFDCNFQRNNKKVMTKQQQEFAYAEHAKIFDSARKQDQKANHNQTQKDPKLISNDTFRTINYEQDFNSNGELDQNEFLNFQNETYEKLNFDSKLNGKTKPLVRKQNQLMQKSQKAIQKHQAKYINSKQKQKSETILQNRNLIQKNYSKKTNLAKIQNQKNNFKNLEVLKNNNTQNKQLVNSKVKQSSFSKQNFGISKGEKLDLSYAALAEKKQSQYKKNTNETLIVEKDKIPDLINSQSKRESRISLSKQSKQKSRNSLKQKQKDESPNKLENRKKIKQSSEKQMKNNLKKQSQKDGQIVLNNLSQVLASSNSQLRFTIKMSRQQYKSLLQLKSKMGSKKVK